MTDDDPHGQAERLRDAIVTMADRYGKAQAEYGEIIVSYGYAVPEHLSRTLDRRLAAVRRARRCPARPRRCRKPAGNQPDA